MAVRTTGGRKGKGCGRPPASISSVSGDLILWAYRLLHGTLYGGNRRRMLGLELSAGS